MNPSIASLTKKLGLPLAFFRIEGGYGVQPRWSDVVRKGKMRAYVSRVVEPEEYKDMSSAELFALIEEGLSVDEVRVTGQFRHKKNAEFLERAMYVCPWCGLSSFESHGDIIRCVKCGRQVRHLPTKELQGVGFESPFRFVNDWYEYQKDFVNGFDPTPFTEIPIYEDRAKVSEVIVYKRKEVLMKDAPVRLYGNRIELGDTVLPFEEISTVAVLGKNKLNIYHTEKLYQLKSDKRFNALKYVNLFYRSKNILRGESDGKFLGL